MALVDAGGEKNTFRIITRDYGLSTHIRNSNRSGGLFRSAQFAIGLQGSYHGDRLSTGCSSTCHTHKNKQQNINKFAFVDKSLFALHTAMYLNDSEKPKLRKATGDTHMVGGM